MARRTEAAAVADGSQAQQVQLHLQMPAGVSPERHSPAHVQTGMDHA